MTSRLGPDLAPVSSRLHVECHGPDQDHSPPLTLVLCHGLGGSARNFRPQVRALREHFRVVTYDARGHARSCPASSQPGTVPGSLDALVDDLGWVLDNFAGTEVVVGGLSMGAATALAYSLKYPARVRGLLLASYPSVGDRFRTWALDFASHIERDGLASAFETYVGGEASRFDEKSRELIRQGFLEHSDIALSAILRFGLAQLSPISELAEPLSKLSMPTRIVVGSEDTGALESSALLARLIPNATLSVLDGAGHVVNLERAAPFNNALRELISQVIQ